MNAVIAVSRAMRARVLPAELCDRDLLVLLAYAEHADPGGKAWPSGETVAAMVRVSRSSVTRSIRALVAAGLLVPGKRRRNDSTVYTLNLSKLGNGQPDDRRSDDVQPDDRQSDSDDRQSDALSSHDPPTLSEGEKPHDRQRDHRGKVTPPRKRQRDPDKPPAHPKHRELFDFWLNLAEQRYAERPATGGKLGGRIGLSISKLLEAYNGDAAKVRAAVERCSQDRRKPSIHQVANDPNAWGPIGLVRPEATAQKPPKPKLRPFDPDRDLPKLGVGT